MREEIQAQMYVPHWDLIYLNTSNNAKQRIPSLIARQERPMLDHEQESDLRRIENRHQNYKPPANLPRISYSHNSREGKTENFAGKPNALSELNYSLMKENIAQKKRVRIMKQVKSIFNEMFTEVQDSIDDLKLQLDKTMKEHRKANKMFNKLHIHISDLHYCFKYEDEGETDYFGRNDMELESVRHKRTPHKLILPKVESANSSRPCSLPDVFKVESPTNSPVGEWFSTSKTNNIRKIAVKKSQEKSLMGTQSKQKKKKGFSDEGEDACEPRDGSLKTNSASMKSSKKLTQEKPNRKHRVDVIGSLLSSDSGLKNNIVTHGIKIKDNSTAISSNESLKDISGNSILQCKVSADPFAWKETVIKRSKIHPQTFEMTTAKSRDENISVIRQKSNGLSSQYRVELLKGKDLGKKIEKCAQAKAKPLPKLKREQIVEKIKSIEDCIIQPNKMKKECIYSFIGDKFKRQEGTNTNKQILKK